MEIEGYYQIQFVVEVVILLFDFFWFYVVLFVQVFVLNVVFGIQQVFEYVFMVFIGGVQQVGMLDKQVMWVVFVIFWLFGCKVN